jgi:hypothetical protein
MPAALRIIVEEPRRIDAVTGLSTIDDELGETPQNYLVCPPQRALDGVRVSADCVEQFVTRDGSRASCSVLMVVAMPTLAALPSRAAVTAAAATPARCDAIRQALAPDPYGPHCWDGSQAVAVRMRLLPAERYAAVTGEPLPETLVETSTYRGWRLP